MSEQEQTITINEKEYKTSELSPAQRNTIGLILKTENRIVEMQGEMALLQTGVDGMKAMLIKDLEAPKEEG
jgi:hypothetical protein